jgi:hypothetical protein
MPRHRNGKTMNTIIVHTTPDEHWSPVDSILASGGRHDAYGAQKTTDTGWIRAYRADEVRDDYEPDEWQIVEGHLPEPISYLVEWRDDELLVALVRSAPEGAAVVIDNDHGVICLADRVRHHAPDRWIRCVQL